VVPFFADRIGSNGGSSAAEVGTSGPLGGRMVPGAVGALGQKETLT
jgi:hypothetical protein